MGESSGNVMTLMKGLTKFDGKNPRTFREWSEKTGVMVSVSRPDIASVMEGQTRPTEETSDEEMEEESHATSSSAALWATTPGVLSRPATLAERQLRWDRANQDLYALLFLATTAASALIVRKHKIGAMGARGNGQGAWKELSEKYLYKSKEIRRALLQQLSATNMTPGQDPDEYFLQATLIRGELAEMGEPVSDERFQDIMVQGLSKDYEHIKHATHRDDTYTIEQIQHTMRNFYMDEESRRRESKGRVAGRGAAMTVESTRDLSEIICHNCKKPGHYMRRCPTSDNGKRSNDKRNNGKQDKNKKGPAAKGYKKPGSGGGGGQKWCSVHKSTTHNDAECYKQGAKRAESSGAYTATVLSAAAPPPADTGDPVFKVEGGFDGGFMWMASTGARTFAPSNSTMTMLVDSGATEHFLDDELIPGLKQLMQDYNLLEEPKKIVTAGNQVLLGTATGILPCVITDQNGSTHQVGFPSLIVSGLGRHLFSSSAAAARGTSTIIEAGHPRLTRGDIIVPLQQLDGDMGLSSFEVGLGAESSVLEAPPTSAIALAAQASADIWHRRLGHMNPRSMELLRKTEGNGVEFTGAMSPCDICAMGKSQQKAHPKKTEHDISGPMELVYTDLMGPIKPAAIGGFLYVSKFTDHFSRMKEIFLLKTKADAVDSLHLYNKTVSVPLGLRVQRLRTDKGGEYTGEVFRKLCHDTGITQEYTATNTPQQNGVSERDGRTLATMARCLIKDGGFPLKLWGEMFFTAVYLTNRAPHSALGGATPFFKMYKKEADMTALRSIGARAFVHIETHTTKLADKAWEGKLCGFSTDSRAYRA